MGTGGSPLKSALSVTAELAGIAAIVLGCWVIAPWLGLIVGGLLMILIGVALDPPTRGRAAASASEDL